MQCSNLKFCIIIIIINNNSNNSNSNSNSKNNVITLFNYIILASSVLLLGHFQSSQGKYNPWLLRAFVFVYCCLLLSDFSHLLIKSSSQECLDRESLIFSSLRTFTLQYFCSIKLLFFLRFSLEQDTSRICSIHKFTQGVQTTGLF